ncbi:MAG: hypothetical protein AB1716_14165 [Planctomycetota bacterium]
MHAAHRGLLIGAALAAAASGSAQLRIGSWNISNYTGGRTAEIQTVVYGVYQGRSFQPDILVGQEFWSAAAVGAFRNALNTAPSSPGDWAAAAFVSGCDTAFFYRTSKVVYVGYIVVSQGGSPPNPPRSTVRQTIRLQGYTAPQTVLCCYPVHMQSGTGSGDQARRLVEAERIRADAALLDPAWQFLLVGDLNIQSSAEAAYEELVGAAAGSAGQLFDPIVSPGRWHDGESYRFLHTQDPVAAAGGMDDRFDQILLGGGLIDGDGFDYRGDANTPFSTTTWNDALHSYRAWGNDGTSFNTGLRVVDNAMVGPAIAQAIIDAATPSGGHIPVFLELRVPPQVGAPERLDFGRVWQGAAAEQVLEVWNAGDIGLWTAVGIAELRYMLGASAGFTAPGGLFREGAGGAANEHIITMDTGTPGVLDGTVTISSNSPDEPQRTVIVTGEVLPFGLVGDMDCNGVVDFGDINPFVLALGGEAGYVAQYPACNWWHADVNRDGRVDFGDINPFVALLIGE